MKNVALVTNLINGVSIYTKCKLPVLLAKAIYTNSAHQRVIELVNTKKGSWFSINFSGTGGKTHAFWRDQPGFEPAFCWTFFLPFQISYCIRKAFILNKNEGNNKKVENKSIG